MSSENITKGFSRCRVLAALCAFSMGLCWHHFAPGEHIWFCLGENVISNVVAFLNIDFWKTSLKSSLFYFFQGEIRDIEGWSVSDEETLRELCLLNWRRLRGDLINAQKYLKMMGPDTSQLVSSHRIRGKGAQRGTGCSIWLWGKTYLRVTETGAGCPERLWSSFSQDAQTPPVSPA